MAPKVEGQSLYNVYQIGEDHLILPEGDFLSHLKNRLTGKRVVEVADTNGDGPGDGDTAILVDGSRVDHAHFSHPLIQKFSRQESWFDLSLRRRYGKEIRFEVEDIKPQSAAGFCIALAGSMQNYFYSNVAEAKSVAESVTDHPAVAGAIMAGGVALSFHPAGRVALEAVGCAGAVGGAGYMVYDRVDGVVNNHPMGEHDFSAGLAMAGGTSALKGMTVAGFIDDTLQGLKRAGDFLTPPLAAVGANGGSMIFSNAVALEAAPIITADGKIPTMMIATFPTSGGGTKVRALKVSDGLSRLEDAAWNSSRAKKSIDDIRSCLELAEEEGKISGGEAALKEIDQNLKVIEELYRHAPDEEMRVALETILRELETEALSLFNNSDGQLTQMTLDGLRQRMLIARDLAQKYRVGSFKVPTTEVPVFFLEIPEGIQLAKPLEEMLPANPGKRDYLLRALEKFLENFRKGIKGDTRKYGNSNYDGNIKGISAAKFHAHGGPRIYYVEEGGVTHVLGVGDKETQERDLVAAKKLAETLGFLGISMAIVDDQNADNAAPISDESN